MKGKQVKSVGPIPQPATANVQGPAPVPGRRYVLVDEELFQSVLDNLAEQKFKDVAALVQRLGGVSAITFPKAPPPDAEKPAPEARPNGAPAH